MYLHLHVRTCRLAPFPYLGKGRTDYAEIWCVVRDSLARLFTKVYDGVHLHVRMCARADVPVLRIPVAPLSYLGIGWTDRAEIWYVVSDPLARLFAKVKSGAQLHVRTYPPLFYLVNGWMDCAEIWCEAGGPLAMHFTRDGGYLHGQTGNCHSFKYIYSLPLVHRPKGVLPLIEQTYHSAKIASEWDAWSCRYKRFKNVAMAALTAGALTNFSPLFSGATAYARNKSPTHC